MNKLWIVLTTLVLCGATVSGLWAEDSGRRFDPVGFLHLAAGARAQALAGAFTAKANDGTAPYWNPAFIASQDGYEAQITLMALPLTMERRASYISYMQRLGEGWGSMAASWSYYRIGAIEERDQDGQYLGDMEDLQNAFVLSYGNVLGQDWKVGANLKYYWHHVQDAQGTGMGLDLAAAYNPKGPWLRWEFGAMLREISPGLSWTTGHQDAIWPTLRLGAAYHILYDRLVASLDVETMLSEKAVPHLGVEWWAMETGALRMGLDTNGVHAGIGYRFGPYQADYSYSIPFEGLSDEHRIALMYKL